MMWIVLAGAAAVGGAVAVVRRRRGGRNSGQGRAYDAATRNPDVGAHSMHTLHEGQTHY